MKNYALIIFLGSLLVLVVKVFNDIRNEINPFENMYSLSAYLIIIFGLFCFTFFIRKSNNPNQHPKYGVFPPNY